MYSQIFVLARRYHSPGRPLAMCPCIRVRRRLGVLFFAVWGWNSFRGPTPSPTAAAFDCFDYPYLIPRTSPNPVQMAILFPFQPSASSFQDSRLRVLPPPAGALSRGNLSFGVQVPMKSRKALVGVTLILPRERFQEDIGCEDWGECWDSGCRFHSVYYGVGCS